MNQTILIVGIIVLLAVQFGLVNLKPLSIFLQGSGYESDGDEEYDVRKHRRKTKSNHKHHRKSLENEDRDEDDAKHIPGTTLNRSKKNQNLRARNDEDLLTTLDSLSPDIRKGTIRGSDLVQDQSVPWKQQPQETSGLDDPEEIQMRIMEELEANSMNHTQLIPSPF